MYGGVFVYWFGLVVLFFLVLLCIEFCKFYSLLLLFGMLKEDCVVWVFKVMFFMVLLWEWLCGVVSVFVVVLFEVLGWCLLGIWVGNCFVVVWVFLLLFVVLLVFLLLLEGSFEF